jgi:DNA repair protein RadD
MGKVLRPYQTDALAAIKQSVGQGIRRLVCQAPTGSGKTLLASAIVEGALRKGNRMVFVVPAIQLIDQTVEMFWHEGIREIGVIQANHPLTDWSKPVQVASIQTVRSRGAYPEAKVVVIDECHQLHKAHIAWMGRLGCKEGDPPVIDAAPGWDKVPFIGLSATPWTTGLGRFFETLLVMSTTKELIEQGYLSKFKVFAADHPDLSKVKTVAGDYHEGQLTAVMQQEGLVANIIETWRTRWNKDRTLLFAVDCAHAQMLQARFQDAGISCGYQDANTSLADRAALKRGFHNGEVRVIANVGTLTTGVDYDVRCLILARPTKSEMLFTQIVGRALRTADGKDHAVILDHTDTTARLGFVTDIHHEHLSRGKLDSNKAQPRKPPLPKPCPQCTVLIPVGCKKCPECGFERKIESKITERDGQLVEFDGTFRKQGKTNPHLLPYSYEEKARFYAQLRGYAVEKGYKPGWAWHKYQEKFNGERPASAWEHHHPMQPGPEVRQFVRAGFIAWAKSPSNPNNRPGAT